MPRAGDLRPKIVLACSICQHRNYTTTKSRRNSPGRLQLRKYCPTCGRTTVHRETR